MGHFYETFKIVFYHYTCFQEFEKKTAAIVNYARYVTSFI